MCAIGLYNTVLQPAVGKDDSGSGAILYAYELANGHLKAELFVPTLMHVDLPLVLIGVGVIFVMLWIYSGSLLFTIMAWVQIILGLALAYGLYEIIVPFFPLLNMPGAFICLGVAADDIFVFLEARERTTSSPHHLTTTTSSPPSTTSASSTTGV